MKLSLSVISLSYFLNKSSFQFVTLEYFFANPAFEALFLELLVGNSSFLCCLSKMVDSITLPQRFGQANSQIRSDVTGTHGQGRRVYILDKSQLSNAAINQNYNLLTMFYLISYMI